MSKILLFIYSTIYFLDVRGQELPMDVKRIIQRCDSESVFTTIIKAKKLKRYFPDSIFKKYYNEDRHSFRFENSSLKSSFIKYFANYYFSASNKSEVLETFSSWCIENRFLDSLGEIDAEKPPEAILYNTDLTKHLVTSLLNKSYPQQGWYSLSSYQLYELNISYLNYLDTLSAVKREKLHSELLATAKKRLK